jgi:ABC-type transporter Mla maintaining outer membrane lipid asymmetry permease subunit MlaE
VRAAAWSLATAATYALVGGFLFAAGAAEAFARFDALALLALAVELSFLRELGPTSALVAAGLTATVVFHQWGKKGSAPLLRTKDAWVLGVIVPAAFAISVPFGLLGGAAVCVGFYGESASEYLHAVREHWTWSDAAAGGLLAAVFGIVLAAIASLSARTIARSKRHVTLKLAATWVALRLAAFVVSWILVKLLPG